jgi:hypothetical protein
MADSQGAIEQIDDLDLDDERVTAFPISIYDGAEIEDSGGYNNSATRREAQVDPEHLRAAGWAAP